MDSLNPATDLFKSMRFPLIVGRILGVLPITGVFRHNKNSCMSFKTWSMAWIYSSCIVVILMANLVFGVIYTIHQPKRNPLEIASSVASPVAFCWGLFMDVVIITMVIMSSAILENATLHMEYISELDHINKRFSNDTVGHNALETLYIRSSFHWYRILGYHEVFAVISFIQHKYNLYGWNLVDIIIASFSRAIYFKFKMLYQASRGNVPKTRLAWTNLAEDHKKICDLLQKIEDFFSPLVFGSFAVNIFYICIQLLEGLVTDGYVNSVVHSIYAPWSFLHITMRVFIVYVCAARINTYAHKIAEVVRECPSRLYSVEVARLEEVVTIGPQIGLSGLGCFVVTKPFILQILGVVFTVEIVLLQGAPTHLRRLGENA